MINIDNIFSQFSSEDQQDSNEKSVYVDFTNTPIYWLGMYKKIILYHFSYGDKASQFFQNVDDGLDIEDIKKAGEWVAYNRAWHYIQHINVIDEKHCAAIHQIEQIDEYFEIALKLGIKFFEELEQYERCALIKKILDKSKEVPLSLDV